MLSYRGLMTIGMRMSCVIATRSPGWTCSWTHLSLPLKLTLIIEKQPQRARMLDKSRISLNKQLSADSVLQNMVTRSVYTRPRPYKLVDAIDWTLLHYDIRKKRMHEASTIYGKKWVKRMWWIEIYRQELHPLLHLARRDTGFTFPSNFFLAWIKRLMMEAQCHFPVP